LRNAVAAAPVKNFPGDHMAVILGLRNYLD
jgi:hypothetical protein